MYREKSRHRSLIKHGSDIHDSFEMSDGWRKQGITLKTLVRDILSAMAIYHQLGFLAPVARACRAAKPVRGWLENLI
jgi:hypothetical protein